MADLLEQMALMQMLAPYRDKNFVQRIQDPSAWPVLDYGGGNYATHKMSVSSADGKHFAYPNVVYEYPTNKLKELPPKEAFQYAMKTGEAIPFDDLNQAIWFSENYKKLWEK